MLRRIYLFYQQQPLPLLLLLALFGITIGAIVGIATRVSLSLLGNEITEKNLKNDEQRRKKHSKNCFINKN